MNICVFCGSSAGNHPVYTEHAQTLGKLMAEAGHALVYGGAKIGLMGIVADSVLANHGKVFGILPSFLSEKEVAHPNLTQLEIVGTMHERKMRMANLAHVFVALPGGWGTIDELAEILTWKQLGLIKQPVFLLNTLGFFDNLTNQFQKMTDEGFLRQSNLSFLSIVGHPSEIISKITQ